MNVCLVMTGLVASVLGFGCCEESLRSEQRSPSGEWLALVTVSDCGALADYGTAVSLRRAHRWFPGKDQIVVAIEGRHTITVAWRDDHTLIVTLPPSAIPRDFADKKIDTKNDEVAGVHIEYDQT